MLGMKRAINLGINIPNVIASSCIMDKYLFRYIIMDYINGVDGRTILKHYSIDEKVEFVRQLKENINKLNIIIETNYPTVDVKEKSMANSRWNVLSNEIVAQRRELVKNYNMPNKVYVHGDITGDNVLITQNGMLYIIDFADGTIAPKEYEFAPILFDLFDFDKLMIDEFIGTQNIEEFTEKCFYGILMHEFGIYFVKLICERIIGIELCELTDIFKVKEALICLFAR